MPSPDEKSSAGAGQGEAADDRFAGTKASGGLRGISLRGGAASGLAQGLNFAMSMVSLVVLARILEPSDYGLVAIVTTFSDLAAVLTDLGLSQATIQRERLRHEQASTLFWVNAAAGVLACSALCAASPVIAWIYGEPRLEDATLVLSLSFVLTGITAQHMALLRRAMRFELTSALSVGARALGVATAIGAAVHGFGFWSLIAGLLAEPLFLAVGVWFATRWTPSRPRFGTGVRAMLGFGANLTGATVLNYIARSADTALVGWVAGASQLGLYSRAFQLVMLPSSQINAPLTTVALPALSRLQESPERYRAFYQKGVGLVATLSMPAFACLFVTADQVVRIVLGEKWLDAVQILRLLSPAAFVGTINVATEWVYVSLGYTHRLLRWGAFSAAIRLLSYAVGAHWGAIGVASAYSLSVCALRAPSILYCFKGTPLSFADLSSVVWRPALASLMAAGMLYCLRRFEWAGAGIAGLMLQGMAYFALYLGSIACLPGGVSRLRELWRLRYDFIGKGVSTPGG